MSAAGTATHATDRPPEPLRRIVLATDLGAEAPQLFADALGLALRARAELTLLHIEDVARPEASWRMLPTVRELLERWGTLPAGASHEEFERLGVHVRVLDRAPTDGDIAAAVARRVAELRPDLVLLGTSARTGFERLARGSVAETAARGVHPATLFVPHHARPIVEAETGTLRLQRVVVPVTSAVPQQPVVDLLHRLLSLVAPGPVAFRLVHVGSAETLPDLSLPARTDWMWRTDTRSGLVVEEIVAAAHEHEADLVAMATRGHDSLLDTVRGSVTERVLRLSPCAVLSVRV
jgi:nucleotide-binding universal stress UspA family protein